MLAGLLLAATVTACFSAATASSSNIPTFAPEPTAVTAAKINLNTATAEQILTVPNAGNRMVREF